ncbi:hypothetical protein MNV49_004080 [Pseudohyphozyma bogoriensis]|nr:hypothetical protein MNV49_004080 [Pseudohyphozyma bogoriensis]
MRSIRPTPSPRLRPSSPSLRQLPPTSPLLPLLRQSSSKPTPTSPPKSNPDSPSPSNFSTPRYNYTPNPFSTTSPDPNAHSYRMVTAKDLATRTTPPKRVKMLVRDFIDDCLYNPNYGYFSTQVEIFDPDEGVGKKVGKGKGGKEVMEVRNRAEGFDFGRLRSSREFEDEVARRYGEFESREGAMGSGKGRQVWHTPTELFKPWYGRAIARFLVSEYKLNLYPYEDLIIYEIGAGNGTLMGDILDYIAEEEPEVYERTRYRIVEISERLQGLQRGRAKGRKDAKTGGGDDGKKVEERARRKGHERKVEVLGGSIFDWERVVPEPCFFLAMEVLDNFSHDLIRYTTLDHEPLQCVVSIDSTGDYSELYEPITDPLIARYLRLRARLPQPHLRRSPLLNPFLASSPLLRKIAATLPFAPNLTKPEWIPTKQLMLLDQLRDKFPAHRILFSDFSSLPDAIEGVNAPVVQTRYEGETVACTTYLVQPGFFDIFFPTDFHLLRDLYSLAVAPAPVAPPVPPAHDFPDMSTAQAVGLTLTLTLAMVLNICQVGITNTSIKHIQESLNISQPNVQWLSSSYSVAFASFLLLFGRLSDIYGAKRVFMLGVTWFMCWSIGVGFAQNEYEMDIFRAFQGVGNAAAIPAALGILGSSFAPGQAKSNAFACFSGGAPIGGSLGIVLGGVMTTYAPAGWRASFFITAGLAALVLICAWFVVPADKPRQLEDRTVDWLGGALITVGLVLFTFSLADGSSAAKGWRTPYIPTLFVISILVIVGFWFWERHLETTGKRPLMPPSIWSQPKFAWVQLIGAFGYCAFTPFVDSLLVTFTARLTESSPLSAQYFATLFYQDYQLLSPILVTIRFLPSPMTGICLNLLMAYIASRIPANFIILTGAIGEGLCPLLFAIQDPNATYWRYNFPAQILSVFGADLIYAPSIMYVSKVAGPGRQGLAGGIFTMTTQIGVAFGLAVDTIMQTQVTAREVRKMGGVYSPDMTDIPLEATLKGLTAAFWGCSAFAFAAAVIAVCTLWGIGYVGHGGAPKKPKVEKTKEVV